MKSHIKLVLSLAVAIAWTAFGTYLSLHWVSDLVTVFGLTISWILVSGIALIPGFFNMFLLVSLILDKRRQYSKNDLPPITILVAAYNEERTILHTLRSIERQEYPNDVEIIVCDDGSKDLTAPLVEDYIEDYEHKFHVRILTGFHNAGKSAALNRGLNAASHHVIVTVDADTTLHEGALMNLVAALVNNPKPTGAVAGAIVCRNVHANWLTRMQDWDYTLSISSVKRAQSMYNGTLVAQGAFSAYFKDVLDQVGGWSDLVGEDIVLTWAIRHYGYNVDHAENAIAYTNVPDNVKQFFNQRRRWARGLIEAFKQHPDVIWNVKQNSIFIWLNVLFPYLDTVFMFGFIPGLIAALFFHWYGLVSMITLILLPVAIIMHFHMLKIQQKTFDEISLEKEYSVGGFVMFLLLYQILMVPACLRGYWDEFLNLRKTWGTKSGGIEYQPTYLVPKLNQLMTVILLLAVSFPGHTSIIDYLNFDKKPVSINVDYWSDNQGFEAVETNALARLDDWAVHYSNYTARIYSAAFSYNTGLVTRNLSGANWRVNMGAGVMSTSAGNTNPIYNFTGNYQIDDRQNIELSSERIPLMTAYNMLATPVYVITDIYVDDIVLSYGIQATDNFSIAVGGITQLFQDGNARWGGLAKATYEINSNWLVSYRGRMTWMDFSTQQYFSPKEWQQHWLLLTYAQPFWNDNAQLKISAGPGVTKIDTRVEATWIAEAKVVANVAEDVKVDVHADCNSSVYNYRICDVGAGVTINF